MHKITTIKGGLCTRVSSLRHTPKTQHTCWDEDSLLLYDVYGSGVFCEVFPLAIKLLSGLVSPARACVFSTAAAVVIQAVSSPSVDPFTDNSSPFIENNQIFQFSKCWLIVPSSSQHLSSSPSTFPKGLRAGKKMWCRWEKALNAREWLEIHSKLMGNKDNVLLIFSPITLWLMCRCWGGWGWGGLPDSLHLMKLPVLLPKQLWAGLCLLR